MPHMSTRAVMSLERWFGEGVAKVVCLPWDATTGLHGAKLLADLRRAGQSMPITDRLIAATALVHGLTIATRNAHDFQRARVKVFNPFA